MLENMPREIAQAHVHPDDLSWVLEQIGNR
jgi:hypothetical protein